MTIPLRINKPPIVEAMIELYFESEQASALLLGSIYNDFKEEFDKPENLPILQMPSDFIEAQPELRHAIHYRIRNNRFTIGIGQRVLTINRLCYNEGYDGWENYQPVVKKAIESLEKSELVGSITRTSVKYMNVFPEGKNASDIFNMKFEFMGDNVDDHKDLTLAFYSDVENGKKLAIYIGSNSNVTYEGTTKVGTLLNVDAISDQHVELSKVSDVINELHEVAGRGFFEAVKPSLIEEMEPEYE